MKVSLKLALLLLCVSSLSKPAQTAVSKQPFTIAISPEHVVVKSGDQVVVKVKITNTSDHDLDMSASINDETGIDPNFDFEVRDSKGILASRRMSKHPGVVFGSAIPGRILKPGESITETQTVGRLLDLDKPGKYTIRASRRAKEDPNVGVVESNLVSVTVAP